MKLAGFKEAYYILLTRLKQELLSLSEKEVPHTRQELQ